MSAFTTLRVSKQAACSCVARTLLEIAHAPRSPAHDRLLERLLDVILEARFYNVIVDGVEPRADDVLL